MSTTKTKRIPAIPAEIKEELLDYYRKVWKDDSDEKSMIDYCVGDIGHATKLSNGLILIIKKPQIETRFCFGESGHDYDEAWHMAYEVARTKEYFMNANLNPFRNMIDKLKLSKEKNQWGDRDNYIIMSVKSYYTNTERKVCQLYADRYPVRDNEYETLSVEDIDKAINLYESALKAFEKRVIAYWKRYGASKLKTLTYWRDE